MGAHVRTSSADRTTSSAWGSVLLVVTLVLGGCSSVAELSGPDPADTAEELARALASGDFTGLDFAETTPLAVTESYDAVLAGLLEGLGEVQPDVSVGEVAETDASATATLSWGWLVAGEEWRYQSSVELTEAEDGWQVTWSPSLIEPSLAEGDVLDVSSVGAERGPILGAGRTTLVTDRPVLRFGIDRSQVPPRKAGASARALAALADIDVKPYAQRVEAAGDKAFVEAIVHRRGEVPDALAAIDQIPGARAVGAELPLAPTRGFAAPILGTVGEVTAEMIEKEPERYSLGDQAGLSGLQARYDDQLRGTPGAVVAAVEPDGIQRDLFRVRSSPGRALRLTLDLALQRSAESLLADVGPASAIVAVRPSTGAVLAAANGPGNNGYNMATYGQFAPGSTFKSVSSLALLRAGLTAGSMVPCASSITVNGKVFTNYSDYPSGGLGRIPLRTAVANSCNTAFISQADRLDESALGSAAASLGLGVDHEVGFPAYFGSVPTPESETEAAADLIGQGTILASPLAMATVIASIQSGRTVLPQLVTSVEVDDAGDVEKLTAGEAATLRALLRGVVTSGSGRLLADVPGAPVIAKTGTAEFEVEGTVLTHAWMIAAQGDLAVAVFVDRGESGSGTAGPILEAFLRGAASR